MAKLKRSRSPNYPVVGLQGALEYLDTLYKFGGSHLVPMSAVVEEAWGMKSGSTYGKQVVAALLAFGLIEDTGSGETRKVRVSDAGAKIRGDHSNRPLLLKNAALLPKIHSELWAEFGNGDSLPPKAAMRQYLVFDRTGNRFNESSVDDFIDKFVATVEFAKLHDTADENDTTEIDSNPIAPNQGIQIGSLVQWTLNGVDQYKQPRRVLGLSDDGKFAFVEGGKTGIPINQTTLKALGSGVKEVAPPVNPFTTPEVNSNVRRPGEKEDVYTLDEGDVILHWPSQLSEASYAEIEDWFSLMLRKMKRAIVG